MSAQTLPMLIAVPEVGTLPHTSPKAVSLIERRRLTGVSETFPTGSVRVQSVALGQRRKDLRSMRRRSGQGGSVARKGNQWHIRFYVDDEEGRHRKSIAVGPAIGSAKITKSEAQRKGAAVIGRYGVNTPEHLEQAMRPESVETFKQRVEWARKNRRAWTEGKPGPVKTMESQITKHLMPRFGPTAVRDITERSVQEFIADLTRTTFEKRKPNGDLIKTYRLSRKTVSNIVGLLKLIVGKKVWRDWDIDLGRPSRPKQRYFTEDELARIIDAAPGFYKVLFALLAGSGLRIGEAAGLYVQDVDLANQIIHVRRSIWNGQELAPKTDNGYRDVDIDATLTKMLKDHIGERKAGRLFQTRKGTPLSHGNIRNRILKPLLNELGIAPAGLHAFRHSRVTMLRKAGTPGDLQKQWLGHSSLNTTDRYSHTHEELEYRKKAAGNAGLDRIVGPNGPNQDLRVKKDDAA